MCVFVFQNKMANFEAFRCTISSSISLLFLKSALKSYQGKKSGLCHEGFFGPLLLPNLKIDKENFTNCLSFSEKNLAAAAPFEKSQYMLILAFEKNSPASLNCTFIPILAAHCVLPCCQEVHTRPNRMYCTVIV